MAADMASVQDMLQVKSAKYRPPALYKPTFLQYGLPPFTLATVEWMRRDPQVRLGMSIKLAPYHVVKLTIKADPDVSQFMANMIRRFWMKALPKVMRAFWYTRSGGEIVYRQKNDRFEFWNYHDVYPSDIAILLRNHTPVGVTIRPSTGVNDSHSSPGYGFGSATDAIAETVEVQPIRMLFPKGFLYLHNREFNSLDGQSDFESAYEAWLEKSDQQGAKHSRKLWFYKSAFSGGILLHPPGSYFDENNQEIPYSALARQALETSLNGSIWTFEQKYDPITKQPMWQYIEPKVNPGGKDILEYVQHLDNEIMRGLGIPDDVVQQVSGTGSYAGRTIPLMAFFISQRSTLSNLFMVCDEQVFRPLCKANFGHDNYEASMEIDIERLMGSMQDGGDGGNMQPNEAVHNQDQGPNQLPGRPAAAGSPKPAPKRFSREPEMNMLNAVSRAMASDVPDAPWHIQSDIYDDSVRVIQVSPQTRSVPGTVAE